MVSGSLQPVGSRAMPDLKALLHVKIVLLRVWNVVSFVLEARKAREVTL